MKLHSKTHTLVVCVYIYNIYTYKYVYDLIVFKARLHPQHSKVNMSRISGHKRTCFSRRFRRDTCTYFGGCRDRVRVRVRVGVGVRVRDRVRNRVRVRVEG
jgi:hypothetical protein